MKQYLKTKKSGDAILGEIPEHWTINKLKFTCSLITDGSHYSPEKIDDGYPLATVENIKDNKIDIDSCYKIQKNDFDYLVYNNCSPKYMDVLFTKDGTVGKTLVYIQKIPIVLLSSIAILRPMKNILESNFCNFFLNSNYLIYQYGQFIEGSAIKRIVLDHIKNFRFILPPTNEQKQIVDYLDKKTKTIDNEVSKNQKLIELLKEKKQSVINHVVTKGLDDTVPMRDSGISWIGKIPKHWYSLKIGTLIQNKTIQEIQDGNHGELHPKTIDFVLDGIPFLTADCVENGKILFEKCNYLTPEFVSKLRIGFSKPGDVILTHKGTLGQSAILPNSHELVMMSPQTTYYRLSDKLSNTFLYFAFQGTYFQDQLFIRGNQSTRYYVGITSQKTLFLMIPPSSEQKQITDYLDKKIKQVDSLISKVELQIKQLQEFRESLISSAVAGKIKVAQA